MTPITFRVRELREARGWTQRELARLANVRPNTVLDIEYGRTTRIDLEVLGRLARALEVDPGYLIVKRGR